MLSIAHGLTGAFVAVNLPSPVIFAPTAMALHYLEDWIPHWDVGTGLSVGKRTKRDAILLELVDMAILAGAIWLLWGQTDLFWLAVAGAFFGLLPDFLEAPRNFWHWEPKWLKPLNDLHGMFHHSTPNKVLGLVPQIIVVVVIVLLSVS